MASPERFPRLDLENRLVATIKGYILPTRILGDLILAGLYTVVAYGSLQIFATLNASVSPVWPPTGLAIAVLILFGPELWPGVFAGALTANLLTTRHPLADTAIAIGNTLEVLVGYYLISRYANGVRAFDHAKTLGIFIITAGLIAPLVSATLGVTTLSLARLALWSTYFPVWLTWWLGDASGALIVAPLILTVLRPPADYHQPGSRNEFIILALAILAAITLLSASVIDSNIPRIPLGFTTVPLVVWGGLRFGPRGASGATALLSLVATARTLAKSSLFISGDLNTTFLSLQFSLMILAVTGLVLGAVVRERLDAVEGMRKARDAERKFQTIVNSAPDAIIISDTSGRIHQINSQAQSLFGYETEEFENLQSDHLISEKSRPQYGTLLAKASSGKLENSGADLEWTGRRKDGTEFPAEVRLGTIRTTDHDMVVTRIKDLSERKRVQEEREQLRGLSAVGEATSMIGHDLRNPLQTVATAVYMMLEKMGAESTSEEEKDIWMKNYLLKIQEQTKYMDKIVTDIQDYTRILKPAFVPVDIIQIVKVSLASLSRRDNVLLKVNIDRESLTAVSDPLMIRRILSNILSNALDAMPNGGQLSVDLSKDDKQVRIQIADTGVGMSKETMDKIYDPFFTTKPRGQGLGLSVTKRLVEALNGRILVYSHEGKGTTFTVELPIGGVS